MTNQMMKCPKCAYQRTAADRAPEWQCPSCGVAYSKATRSAEPQPPKAPKQSASLRAPPPSTIDSLTEDEKLSLVARGQKIAIYSIVLTFCLNALLRTQPVHPMVALLLTFGVGVYSVLGIVRICSGLEKSQGSKITFMVLAFVPLAGLVSLIYLSMSATKLLRSAGWRVGLLGAKP